MRKFVSPIIKYILPAVILSLILLMYVGHIFPPVWGFAYVFILLGLGLILNKKHMIRLGLIGLVVVLLFTFIKISVCEYRHDNPTNSECTIYYPIFIFKDVLKH